MFASHTKKKARVAAAVITMLMLALACDLLEPLERSDEKSAEKALCEDACDLFTTCCPAVYPDWSDCFDACVNVVTDDPGSFEAMQTLADMDCLALQYYRYDA